MISGVSIQSPKGIILILEKILIVVTKVYLEMIKSTT